MAHRRGGAQGEWIWWVILVLNMVLFAWGLRTVLDRDVIVPLSCVWLGAFSCCILPPGVDQTDPRPEGRGRNCRALEERGS